MLKASRVINDMNSALLAIRLAGSTISSFPAFVGVNYINYMWGRPTVKLIKWSYAFYVKVTCFFCNVDLEVCFVIYQNELHKCQNFFDVPLVKTFSQIAFRYQIVCKFSLNVNFTHCFASRAHVVTWNKIFKIIHNRIQIEICLPRYCNV